ncbi:hypothetical protein LI328DRAFT_62381 [Trichoderma asperelloides]|nr:hypothetical protein LI328DRAFT_62381 [Trichoderma asperelloides]
MKRPWPADNLHHSPLSVLSVCFSCCAYHTRSVWLLMTRARPSSLGIDDTTFSPLRPSGRCIFSPPRSYEGQDASIPGPGGRDHHIRLDNASGELLCSVGSVKNGQLTRP